jgi:hypothetical protein
MSDYLWIMPDPGDEPDGPEDEDLVTKDHVHFYEHGGPRRGPVVTVELGQDWRRAVVAWMREQQFYPNVWFLSDHGNAHLLDLNP